MGYARLFSRAERGLQAPQVTVEVHLAGGLPQFSIVGLPETAVREARERVRGALVNCRFEFPASRITVNLAPADLPKHGGRFDLAIALGILAASGQIADHQLAAFESFAELTLSGDLAPVRGLLPACLQAVAARRDIIIAAANAGEALLVEGASVRAAANLAEVAAHLNGEAPIAARSASKETRKTHTAVPDLAEVCGQQAAKRALIVAAAGGHHLLLSGPPGTGKSMLAERLPGLLPTLTDREALECASIRSLLGEPLDIAGFRRRPFRSPHHSASAVAMIGGGSRPRPGEVSLAHRGVLFLDELPEFSRQSLEMLREPLESGVVHLSRAAMRVDYPARFQLIAAMNPCPCGYAGDAKVACRCSAEQVRRYRQRISGPLLDRVDLSVNVTRLKFAELSSPDAAPESAEAAADIAAARELAQRRQSLTNAELSGDALTDCAWAPADAAARHLLETAAERFHLSARVCHRILRVARTIADLAASDGIGAAHMAEAIALRQGESPAD